MLKYIMVVNEIWLNGWHLYFVNPLINYILIVKTQFYHLTTLGVSDVKRVDFLTKHCNAKAWNWRMKSDLDRKHIYASFLIEQHSPVAEWFWRGRRSVAPQR